jgi:hypothetical protein
LNEFSFLLRWHCVSKFAFISTHLLAFTGVTAIITGEFPQSKEYYKGLVEKNGGFVKDNIGAAVCIAFLSFSCAVMVYFPVLILCRGLLFIFLISRRRT